MRLWGQDREAPPRTAIIDIGSNSVRLVVYQGAPRLPAVLFNEKVMAGLGRGLARTGAIEPDAMRDGLAALARFAAVIRAMGVKAVRTVATAAVRDASNGADFIAGARDLGLEVELLSGEAEATAAGLGVLSAIPQADGIVGDLGGGSLELVRIGGGVVRERVSFPLGVLRIAGLRREGKALERRVTGLIRDAGWEGRGRGLPLYLVGGSWRALARVDMVLHGQPLPIIHHHAMRPEEIARLNRAVPRLSKTRLKGMPGLSAGRAATLGDAAALLNVLVKRLESETTIASAFGLREGLLFERLSADERALDPLIVAAREEGRAAGRFPEHGDLLDRWIAPLFADDTASEARLRHAACLLADVAWRAHPEFRAERGLEVALHGEWVAITPAERGMLAQALFTALCGELRSPPPLDRLASPEALARAMRWGLAIRLGQRLSAGVAEPLRGSSLILDANAVTLSLENPAMAGDTVAKRLGALAAALGRSAVLQ